MKTIRLKFILPPASIAFCALFLTSCATGKKETTVTVVSGAARNVTRITDAPNDEINPAVSPDGRTVAFQVFRNKQSDIWTVDSATGRSVVQVTSHPMQDIHPAWMPDSKTLVFSSDRLGSFSLWRQLASGGGGTTMITKASEMNDFAANVSPTTTTVDIFGGSHSPVVTRKIAFTSKAVPKEMLLMSGVKQFTVYEKTMPYIWTVNVDGSALTQLVEGVGPVWAPDGSRIAFASDISGNWDIWSIGKDGAGLTQLTDNRKHQLSPSFSPDGKWIAFSSNVSGNYDIWIMRVEGAALLTQLTTDKSEEVTPCWGADGNIYFCSNKAGNWDIWRLTPVLPESE